MPVNPYPVGSEAWEHFRKAQYGQAAVANTYVPTPVAHPAPARTPRDERTAALREQVLVQHPGMTDEQADAAARRITHAEAMSEAMAGLEAEYVAGQVEGPSLGDVADALQQGFRPLPEPMPQGVADYLAANEREAGR